MAQSLGRSKRVEGFYEALALCSTSCPRHRQEVFDE